MDNVLGRISSVLGGLAAVIAENPELEKEIVTIIISAIGKKVAAPSAPVVSPPVVVR